MLKEKISKNRGWKCSMATILGVEQADAHICFCSSFSSYFMASADDWTIKRTLPTITRAASVISVMANPVMSSDTLCRGWMSLFLLCLVKQQKMSWRNIFYFFCPYNKLLRILISWHWLLLPSISCFIFLLGIYIVVYIHTHTHRIRFNQTDV